MAEGLARFVVGRNPARTLVRVVVLVAVAAVVVTYGILPVRGQGPSMQPTIRDGQLLIVSRVSFALRAPRRGEVVAVRLAGDEAVLIKRILAGPGDRIGISDGQVVVNDVPIAEPYVELRHAVADGRASRSRRTSTSSSATIAACRWNSTRWARSPASG